MIVKGSQSSLLGAVITALVGTDAEHATTGASSPSMDTPD